MNGSTMEVFEALPDLVVLFDDALTIRYANPFAGRLLGFGIDALVGQSLVDFVHPDDLGRAAEVAGLIADDALAAESTPALYRIRSSSGAWIPVEINATNRFETGEHAGMIAIVGRFNGDNVLQDRILEMLSTGTATDDIVDLLPEFGMWRHPEAQYAVTYPDASGNIRVTGSPGAIDLFERFDDADSPWARAARDGIESLLDASQLSPGLRAAAAELGMAGCMALPVPDPFHDHTAVVVGWSARADQDVGAHRYALERMARGLDIIMQWRAHVASLERAARIDALSGVVNRATFIEVCSDAVSSTSEPDQRVAVLYIDLDNFKNVNDSFGHAAGDQVIVEAAARMSHVVTASDVVGRVGGDEFAVLCRGAGDVDVVTSLADRLVDEMARPFDIDGRSVLVGASIGVAVTIPGHGDHDGVLAAADAALYQAKAAGRGRWQLAT